MAIDQRLRATLPGNHRNNGVIAGLDALELASGEPTESRALRLWTATWPKLAAIALALLLWQAVVWSGWRPRYALPGPDAVFPELFRLLGEVDFWRSIGTTMRRAILPVGAAYRTLALGLDSAHSSASRQHSRLLPQRLEQHSTNTRPAAA